ncbi:MAG: hypothetical protein Q7K37_00440 [Dehalococcoidia bacterium]|nr:hypothetical protein [Dehalococcoidia bacterium]
MDTSPRPAAPASARLEALKEACGEHVGDRRVRVPRRERSLTTRICAAVRRLLTFR